MVPAVLCRAQKLEEGLRDGRFPPTLQGLDELCRCARLIGQNCVEYNAGSDEWVEIGDTFLRHTDSAVQAARAHVLTLLAAASAGSSDGGGDGATRVQQG